MIQVKDLLPKKDPVKLSTVTESKPVIEEKPRLLELEKDLTPQQNIQSPEPHLQLDLQINAPQQAQS